MTLLIAGARCAGSPTEVPCPACGGDEAFEFFHAAGLPVHCNRLWPDRETAISAPRADINLAFCTGCGLVFNADFDTALVEYDCSYENALHFSPRFREYQDALISDLTARYALAG